MAKHGQLNIDDKHAGGRPSKYKGEETIGTVLAAADLLRKQPESFLSGCGIEQLADALDVCRDTVYEWAKQYDEFSDAIKTWETVRNGTLYKLAKTLPPAIWIIFSKNMLGWRDRQELEHIGEGGGPIHVRLEKVITTIDPNGREE